VLSLVNYIENCVFLFFIFQCNFNEHVKAIHIYILVNIYDIKDINITVLPLL